MHSMLMCVIIITEEEISYVYHKGTTHYCNFHLHSLLYKRKSLTQSCMCLKTSQTEGLLKPT